MKEAYPCAWTQEDEDECGDEDEALEYTDMLDMEGWYDRLETPREQFLSEFEKLVNHVIDGEYILDFEFENGEVVEKYD